MKRTLLFLLVAIAGVAIGAEPSEAPKPSSKASGKKLLHVTLTEKKDGQAMTKFFADTPRIYAIWQGEALKAGDKLRAIWIAQDVGFIAPRETKITEASVTADKRDDGGVFSLARPEGGWPTGKYRFEIYVGYELAEMVSFTVQKGATVELR
jgi:hypothetical protein